MAELTSRIGKISSINYVNGTARVTYEDRQGATTAEYSLLAWEYQMPAIGDQVIVVHRSDGNVSAIIMGRVWHNDHRPIEGKEGLYRKEFEHTQGVAFERYAKDEGPLYTLKAGGVTINLKDGVMEILGDVKISKNLHIAGNLTVEGNETVQGNESITGNSTIGGSSDVGGSITAGGSITSGGDQVAGSVSTQNHTHTGVHGETSPAH